MKRSLTPGIILTLVLAFFYAPIIVLVVNSFNASRFGGEWKGFTWSWYEKLREADDVWSALGTSLKIAVLTSLATMVLGTLAALALHRFRSRLQNAHRALLTVPLVMPDILMGISLLLFFVAVGIETGFFTIWVAHVTFCLSYVTMVVLARLQDFDDTLIDAARDLGATPFQAARRVMLPLLAPGIIAGGLLAFTLSIDDYVITFFVQGAGTTTLPLRIYSMMKVSRNMPVINALSTLLLFITFVAVSVSFWLTRRGQVQKA
ncbi:spermidine/putrescine ABC transporter permease [Verrucomicrobiaceae bacterium SCGC AG-212-N21]|nr:spermidine/putrescine ABC transporter permease [Verrucomicrobiaceae bacterium SCGC AG-212-N21]